MKTLKDKALDLIDLELKKKQFDLNYLYFLTTNISQTQTSLKNHIKLIRKNIIYLEKHFDETYLLLYNTKNNSKLFNEFENRIFLDYIDELIQLLNMHQYNKEADKLSILKSKIELGYRRYFIISKDVKIYGFSSQTEEYSIHEKFSLKNEIAFKEILFYLLKLKESKNKNFKQDLSKYKKYFTYFPKFIYKNKEMNWLKIEKSLFPHKNFDLKEFKKDKITLRDLNNPLSAALILRILENE